MTLTAQILDQRIRHAEEVMRGRLTAVLGPKAGGDEHRRLSAAFTVMVMKTALGLDDSDAIDALVDGGDDFGVDAVHWTAPRGGVFKVMLVQTKLKKRLDAESHFEEGGVRGMIDAVRTLLDVNADFTGNPRLLTKIAPIRALVGQGNIPQVTAVLANNGRRWTAAAQKRIDNARLGDQVDWVHVGPDRMIELLRPQASIDATLQLTGKYMVEEFDFRRALIGRVAVGELARLFAEHGDQLLERNVRRFLGMGDSRINQGIAATLKDPAEHANFYFYNNGLTVICRKFRHHGLQDRDTPVQVEGMQIVNGGQTSQVVARVLAEMPEKPDASVLLRIYELEDDAAQVVNNITYATNSQNPVVLSDLKANDPIQIRLEQSIEALGYKYRRKRSEKPLEDNEITSAEVARSVLSVWRRRDGTKVEEQDLFGSLYTTIFTPDLNGAQAVMAVLICRGLNAEQDRRINQAKSQSRELTETEKDDNVGVIYRRIMNTFMWNLYNPSYEYFGAQISGEILLNRMGAEDLAELNHHAFAQARQILSDHLVEIADEVLKRLKESHLRREKTSLADWLDASPEKLQPGLRLNSSASAPKSSTDDGASE